MQWLPLALFEKGGRLCALHWGKVEDFMKWYFSDPSMAQMSRRYGWPFQQVNAQHAPMIAVKPEFVWVMDDPSLQGKK